MQAVATAAGVGKATVSLALRNDPRLRPETRARIQALAEKMGYKPNAAVANLMAQLRASRTPKYQATLGLMNASKYPDALSGLHTFRDWTAGARRRASQLGYGIDEFWLNDPAIPPARLARILESRGIRGLVFAAMLDTGTLPAAMRDFWTRFAAVVVGVRSTAPAMHFACNDQYLTAMKAVEEVIRIGYKRPGLVISPQVDGHLEHRFSSGFWSGQQVLPIEHRLPAHPFNERDEHGFRAWFELCRPDVVLCLHKEVKSWIEKMGLRIPEQLGLAHLDRTEDLEGWAGMKQNNDLVGMAAIDMLVGQLHRNESGVPDFPKCILIQSTWRDGGTVRNAESSLPSGRSPDKSPRKQKKPAP